MNEPLQPNEFEQAQRFERELRAEMQSFTMPEGFAERVERRVQLSLRQRGAARRNRLWQQAIAAAVLLSVGLGGGVEMHRRAEQRKAQEAAQQFALAMQITSRSLYAVNRAVNRLDKTNATGEDQ